MQEGSLRSKSKIHYPTNPCFNSRTAVLRDHRKRMPAPNCTPSHILSRDKKNHSGFKSLFTLLCKEVVIKDWGILKTLFNLTENSQSIESSFLSMPSLFNSKHQSKGRKLVIWLQKKVLIFINSSKLPLFSQWFSGCVPVSALNTHGDAVIEFKSSNVSQS